MAAFTERLHAHVQPIWEQNHQHPFVQELGKGTLAEEKFVHYLKQDYVYLIEYAKLFAIGITKANHLDTMNKLASVLHETLHIEMELHRQYAESFGISRQELESAKPGPTNLAYTTYMLNTAQNGTLAEVIACLLPCAWDYWEIGQLLRKQYGHQLANNPYARWIETYDSIEFAENTKWLIQLMDELADGKPERELVKLEEHFLLTSKYEFLFWEMNDQQQNWVI